MATWPSGSKASTTNLDSGTDRPSLARADIKQNVDNVNDIIDMFNISGPTNNQILKYNSTNTRFELASDADLNTTYTISAVTDGSDANIRLTGSDASVDEIQLIAGTNISLAVTSAGAIQINNTQSELNTTYAISAVADGSDANIRLTGSDASIDEIQLIAGSNVALAVTSAGAIQVSATDTNTTYSISAETSTGGVNLRLTDSGAVTDDVKFAEGTGITLTRTDANTITVASTVTDTNTTYSISAITDGSDANIRLTGSDASIDEIQLIAGSNITLAVTSAGAISIAAAGATGMTSFTVAADSGASQTIENGNTLTIVGGTNITSVASATDTVTLNLDATLTGLTAITATTVNTDAIVGIATNGAITITPNGTGDVQLVADTVQVGDSNANATITTNGTGDLILNTNNGSNSSSITIQDAANGNIVLAPNGTGRVQVSGTSSNAGGIEFYEDTDNGTNKALVTAPAALGADVTLTLPATTSTLGYQNIPAVGTKTGSYTLATTDVGKYVQVGSGGSITIPDATFAEGDAIVVANNHTASITITCTITTAYIAGTDTDKASVSLATRGVATILFLSSTVCIISGNVS